MRRGGVFATSIAAAFALGACDDVFGLTRHVDAAIDTPVDAAVGGPDAAGDASDGRTDAAIDAPIDAAIDAPVGAVCPAGYVPVMGQGAYRFRTGLADWATAEATCAADQIPGSTRFTHLAVIEIDLERGRLNATQPTPSWIGASDRVVEGTYLWVTAGGATLPASGSPWATGEPDHALASDDCVEMGQTADYAETACVRQLPYWCECDADPVVSTNF